MGVQGKGHRELGKTKTISATEANRQFSKLLREAQEGFTVTITSRGQPVAVLSGPQDDAANAKTAERKLCFKDYIDSLKSRPIMNLGRFNRDDAYEN